MPYFIQATNYHFLMCTERHRARDGTGGSLDTGETVRSFWVLDYRIVGERPLLERGWPPVIVAVNNTWKRCSVQTSADTTTANVILLDYT